MFQVFDVCTDYSFTHTLSHAILDTKRYSLYWMLGWYYDTFRSSVIGYKLFLENSILISDIKKNLFQQTKIKQIHRLWLRSLWKRVINLLDCMHVMHKMMYIKEF